MSAPNLSRCSLKESDDAKVIRRKRGLLTSSIVFNVDGLRRELPDDGALALVQVRPCGTI